MAIGTDSAIHFFGTEDEVTVASPGAVNAGAFSVTGDVNDWTNDDDAPMAVFKLKLTAAGLSAAPTAGELVSLYCRHMDVEGTEDTPVPDANYPHTYLGSFIVDAVDADQVHILTAELPNYETSQVYEFFIENNMTPNIASSGWELWVTPRTVGPRG